MTDSAPGSVEFARITPKRVSLSAAEQAELSDREAAGELREDAIRAILEGREQAANNGQGAATALASDPSPSVGPDGDPSPDVLRVALGMLPPDARAAALAAMKATFAADPSTPPALLWEGQARTLADAYAPRPPVEQLVRGVITRPSLNITFGPPGSLKSLFIGDLAVCVARGLVWLPRLDGSGGFATQQVPVIWLDFDNGVRDSDDRFEALARARGLPPDTPFYYYSCPSPWLCGDQRAEVEELAKLIDAAGAGLVCIDNLGLILGGADENSAEVVQVLSNLRWLSEQTRAAIILIHHQRKASGITGRRGESLRGHSSIEAALNLALLVERDEGADMVTVRATKVRGAPVKAFGAQFAYDHKVGTTELAKARFYGVDVDDSTSDGALESTIFRVLEDEPAGLSQVKLIAAVQEALPEAGRNRLTRLAKSLVASKKLKITRGDRGAMLYQVVSDVWETL